MTLARVCIAVIGRGRHGEELLGSVLAAGCGSPAECVRRIPADMGCAMVRVIGAGRLMAHEDGCLVCRGEQSTLRCSIRARRWPRRTRIGSCLMTVNVIARD